jgi:hypothetical protein
VPINTPQAPAQPVAPKQVVASASAPSAATAEKRVHATLDGSSAIAAPAKSAGSQVSDHNDADADEAQTKHVASAEFGA